MGKFHITLKARFGEISIDGDSKKETLDLLKDAISIMEEATSIIPAEQLAPPIASSATAPTTSTAKKELEGVIEVTSDGRPQLVILPGKLTAKDVIGLLLYWKYPDGLLLNELTNFVSLSWKAVGQPYVAANIGKMKGLLLKEGPRGKYVFKLSGTGRSWIETELLPKIKA
jgi:hypothetical protein